MNNATAVSPFLETEFVDTNRKDDVDRRAVRWIVFAGDRTTPNFKRTCDGMSIGGENLGHDYKTLAATRGFLRRCELTPMVIGHDDLNADSLGDEKGRYKSRIVWDAINNQSVTIYYNECLPGDELAGLFTACQGEMDYGIREVAVLQSIEPTRKLADGSIERSIVDTYQRLIFPEWDRYLSGEAKFFATTDGLASHLQQRYDEIEDETVREIITVLLESNSQFVLWATTVLDNQGHLVKAPPTAEGRKYSWQPIHHQYFDSLELNKEEFLQKKQDKRESATPSDAPSREEFMAYQAQTSSLMAQMAENSQRLADSNQKLTEMLFARDQNGVKDKHTCGATTANKTPCQKFVQGESDFCAAHQPKAEEVV